MVELLRRETGDLGYPEPTRYRHIAVGRWADLPDEAAQGCIPGSGLSPIPTRRGAVQG